MNHDQQHENQQQKKTASVVINPIASGEIDGVCLKLACNINKDKTTSPKENLSHMQ